jgi:hypothetical protein
MKPSGLGLRRSPSPLSERARAWLEERSSSHLKWESCKTFFGPRLSQAPGECFQKKKRGGTPRECLFLIPKNRGTFFRGLLRVRGGVVRESTPWEVVVHYRCQGRLRRPEEETRIRSRLRQTQQSPRLDGLKGKPWTTGSGQPRLWSRVAASGHV